MPAIKEPLTAFSVGIHYVEKGHEPPDIRIAASNAVAHILETTTKGHIIVFAPGSGEISTICSMIERVTDGVEALPLYSAMPTDSQDKALRGGVKTGKRKCIVATSIAIDAPARNLISYVVDTGVCKKKIYNPRLNMHMLETRVISQKVADGRALGHTCVRLYSQTAYDDMPEETEPEILIKPAHSYVLELLNQGQGDLTKYPKERKAPHPDTLARAVMDLETWDLINEDGQLTQSGEAVHMLTAPVPRTRPAIYPHKFELLGSAEHLMEPIWGSAIWEARRLGCMRDVISIAAVCSLYKPVFQSPSGTEAIADISRAKFANGPSDHLALLNAFNQYQYLVDLKQPDDVRESWCKMHFLNFVALEEARALRDVILNRACQLWGNENEKSGEPKHEVDQSEGAVCAAEKTASESVQDAGSTQRGAARSNNAKILKAIARAFCTQVAMHTGIGDTYTTVDTDVTTLLHSSCALTHLRPRWVVYTELSRRSRSLFLDTVSAIDINWLLDMKNLQPAAMAKESTHKQLAIRDALAAARAKTTSKEASKEA